MAATRAGSAAYVGREIRNIKILEVIGEGGMGTVYLGFDRALERRVVVKTVRPVFRADGAAKARFLREARILSQLEHPSICRIYDYIEDEDDDFLVLELIDGVSLAGAIADGIEPALKMGIAEQLVEVLVAVHGRGVVHRDLKPDNVMVTGDGDVKVLDFGVARIARESSAAAEAAGPDTGSGVQPPEDPEETVAQGTSGDRRGALTTSGSIVGTVTYMSPEQARGEPATAASDMYSYGLILQQLFTGEPPFEEGLKRAALLLKAAAGETRPVTGLPPDLTALIERLKSGEPAARPSSLDAAAFLRQIREAPRRRRRRRLVAAAWAVLTVFAAVMSFQAYRIAQEAERAEHEAEKAQAVSRFLRETLAAASPEQDGREVKVVEVLDRAAEKIDSTYAEQPEIQALVHHTIGETYVALGRYDTARRHFEDALRLYQNLGGETDDVTLRTMNDLAVVIHYQGEIAEAIELVSHTLELRRRVSGPDHPETLATMANLGAFLNAQQRFAEAEAVYDELVELSMEVLGEESDTTLTSLNNLAYSLVKQQRFAEAESRYRQVLEIRQRVNGINHPQTLTTMTNLAVLLGTMGRADESEELHRQVLARKRVILGDDHPETLFSMNGLALSLAGQGRHEEALSVYEAMLPVAARKLAPQDPRLSVLRLNFATSLVKLGRFEQAEPVLVDAYAAFCEAGPASQWARKTCQTLVELYEGWGKPELAEKYRAELEKTDA